MADSEISVSDSTPMHVFKVIVVGDCYVGKTSLTIRYCFREFRHTSSTIGCDFFEKTLTIGTNTVKGLIMQLQIWDTAGQERFRGSLVKQYYRGASAVLFVYDVTDASSFEKLPNFIDECDQCNTQPLIRVLVGNKNEMVEKKCVQTSKAKKFAEFHDMEFYETSAKDENQENCIEKIFASLTENLINKATNISVSKWGVRKSLTDLRSSVSIENSNPITKQSSQCRC